MIVLLNSLKSWCQSNHISFTGSLEDTTMVCIPIEELKIANSKMIELEYEKEINCNLNDIIYNDSILIDGLNDKIVLLKTKEEKTMNKYTKVRKQRNILCLTNGITLVILLIVLL